MSERDVRQLHSDFIQLIQAAVLGLIVAAALWFGYFEPPILVYKNLPFPVQNRTVMVGDYVRFYVARCIHSTGDETAFLTTRTIVNAATKDKTLIPATFVTLQSGCTNSTDALVSVPTDFSPGRYYLAGVVEAHGTIRVRYVQWRSEDFTVVTRRAP